MSSIYLKTAAAMALAITLLCRGICAEVGDASRLVSTPYTGGQEGYACYRAPAVE